VGARHWYTPEIPALRRGRQEDLKFEASLGLRNAKTNQTTKTKKEKEKLPNYLPISCTTLDKKKGTE
jgi:hypothetical protein